MLQDLGQLGNHPASTLLHLCQQVNYINYLINSFFSSECKYPVYLHGRFRKLGVPDLGVLIIRILPFRVLY